MKLGLGTVQFGLDYGITNPAGRTPPDEVRAMLGHAAAHGIETLDTAALYGQAEDALGAALPRPHTFRVVTKTLPLDNTLPVTEALAGVRAGFEQSLRRLGEPRVAALLAHRVDDLLGAHGDAFHELLASLKDAGRVGKIGASVYTVDDVEQLLDRHAIDIVQLPLSVLDQRHLAGGALAALKAAGVEIHVRSAFLQGLLLAEAPQLPAGLQGLAPKLQAWRAHCAELGLPPLQACLGFLKSVAEVDVVVCGATGLAEWRQVVAAWEAAPALAQKALKDLAVADDKLIDPRHWPKR